MQRVAAGSLAAALAASLAAPVSAAPAAAAEPLSVAIVWHQHQPRYPKQPGTNVYEQPWVRVHGTKDYFDMAAMVEQFPGLKLTINLTPVLLEQIEDYVAGASDRHFELAAKPAEQLSAAEKAEAMRRFFQVSGPMLKRHPRLEALKAKPAARYSTQDWRDLQVLFNLAWTDELVLATPALRALAQKGQGYSEAEKQLLLSEHRRVLARLIPLHRRLQDAGRLEVTTTPYYHPILPLLADTKLAEEAMPQASMPALRMRYPEDARFHLQSAVRYYRQLFGRAPRGMWPGEGSVAQSVAPMFKEAGIRWIATDEEVLGRSLNVSLRDGERLMRPEVLYQPYQVANGPSIVFRDRRLSDDIGFRYNKMSGQAAAEDLLGQLRAIAKQPRSGPRLVSIILDGENAWENYPDDGKAFLSALYRGLTTDKAFKTVTPSEYLASHTPKPLPRLWAGSWIGASYATWIGEPEENAAWDLLAAARQAVAAYGKAKGTNHPGYRKAMAAIYVAQGSDWFWWYGQDQDSGRDSEFDTAYRDLIASAYKAIGQQPPAAVLVPIIQEGNDAAKPPKSYISPSIDGSYGRLEWANAGAVFAQGGAMNIGNQAIGTLFYGWDKQNLYLALQFNGPARPYTVSLGLGDRPGGVPRPEAGFSAHYTIAVDPASDTAQLSALVKDAPPGRGSVIAKGGRELAEMAIPWTAIAARSGEPVLLTLEVPGNKAFPTPPLKLQTPVLALKPIAQFEDAADPGIGPGRYQLPAGGAYKREHVDLKRFAVADAGDRWAFTWQLGEVANPWGSPVGLSLVSLDAYLALAEETGEVTSLLSGRQASATRPWAYAIAIEGWQQALYGPGGKKLADLHMVVDPLTAEVRTFVPKKLLAGAPRDWSYLLTLQGQDGFAPGRIRQVLAKPDAEHFGGRLDENGPHLLDVLLPESLPQEQALAAGYEQVVLPYLTITGKVEGTE